MAQVKVFKIGRFCHWLSLVLVIWRQFHLVSFCSETWIKGGGDKEVQML